MGAQAHGSGHRHRIGMDIDGTLALFHEAFIKEYNSRHRSRYTIEDFNSYQKWRIPVSFEEFTELHNMIWKEKWHEVASAVPRSIMHRLSSIYDVEILTHRPEDHEPYVRRWLDYRFPDTELKIKITNNTTGKAHEKYDILFDDAPLVAEEMIRRGDKKSLLMLVNRPWNRTAELKGRTQNIIRVKTLKEGIGLLLAGK